MRCTHLFTLSHWLKGLAVSFHLIHGHSHAHWCLSVFFLLSFYLLPKFLFHLFLIPAMVPDDVSMNNPLCNSAIGSMVSLDYVTPDTLSCLCLGVFGSPFLTLFTSLCLRFSLVSAFLLGCVASCCAVFLRGSLSVYACVVVFSS